MEHNYHHITEDERQEAIRLWNEFNAELDRRGMKLHYDYTDGNFFVADKGLKNGYLDKDGKAKTERTLDEDELSKVIYEGGFDDTAVNNPPWFASTGPGGYTFEAPEDGQ